MSIFAGVNGSGKSTLTRLMADYVGVVIDPDFIARQACLNSLESGKEVIRRVNECIEEGISFSLETTLSGSLLFRQIKQAKEKGFYVRMFYVGVSDVKLNLDRIRIRVSQGGHDIPEEDVLRRYPRSISNLNKAIDVCDEVLIYDNTYDLELVKIVENGSETYVNKHIEIKWINPVRDVDFF